MNEIQQHPQIPKAPQPLGPTERLERKAVLWAMWEARGLVKRLSLADSLTPEECGMLLESIAENEAAKAG